MKLFDPIQFRQQFPAINHAGIYLDSAATALKPRPVIEAIEGYYRHNSTTVHRSHHHLAQDTTTLFEHTRQQVADYLHAGSAREIIWTRGTTEAINLVAQSYVRPRLAPGDEILVSEAEHHANLIPWLMLAEQTGAQIIKLPLAADRRPNVTQITDYLTEKTRVLALGQMSNVTGGYPDLPRAIQAAHQQGAVVVVDGAQGIVHSPPDVQALDIDFYAFSGHKLYGPTGVGVLYGKSRLLADMHPWQGGGKMLTQASFSGFTPQPFPYCFEAGTPHIAGILAMGKCLTWLNSLDLDAAEHYACQLATEAEEKLASLPGFQSYRVGKSSLLAFNFANIHHSDLNSLLAEQAIALRSGQHCAQPLIQALGVSGTLRASFAPYNTRQDVDALYQATRYALTLLDD